MVFEVLLGPKATKALRKMNPTIKERIKDRLRELREQPENLGKRITYSDYWSVRIGDNRAIYKIDTEHNQVLVIFVGHRSSVYDDFSKAL